MISTKHTLDTPRLTLVLGVLTIVSIPIVLYVLFTVWPESLARQIVATAAIIFLIAFVLVRQKFDALLLIIIFLSQFAVSLHSFDLNPPAKLQIYLSDFTIILFCLAAWERKQKIRIDTVGWLFIIWIGWFGIATYFSVHLHRSLIFLSWQIKFFVLYVLVLNIKLSESLIRRIVIAISGVILMQSIIAIAQYVHGGGLGLDILGESFNTAKKAVYAAYYVNGGLRVSGTIGGANGFSGYISLCLVFLLPFVLARRSVLNILCFGVGIIVIILAMSRAGWLSFFVGSIFVIFMMLRARLVKFSRMMLPGLLVGLILTGGVMIYYDKIVTRFEDPRAIASAQGRINQFYTAWRLIEKHAGVGIGPGVSDFFGQWSNNRKYIRQALSGVDLPNYIHNSQLQVWVESGTPGLIIFLAIIAVISWSVFGKVRFENDNDMSAFLRIGGISAAMAVMIHVSFGTEFNNHQIFQLFWILLGLARNKIDSEQEQRVASAVAHQKLNYNSNHRI
jgi:O-antigen ligase